MNTNTKLAGNPYQAPEHSSATTRSSAPSSGMAWLLACACSLVVCALLLGYFCLFEVPVLRADFDQRNVAVPLFVTMGENVVIFTCENFLMLFLLTLFGFVVIEVSTSGKTKQRTRRLLSIAVGAAALLFTALVIWATLAAMNWTSLYMS